MRDHLLGAVIAERQQAAAVRHHLRRALRHRDERIDADVHRHQEIVEAGVHVTAAQLVLVRKADRVDEEVDRRPFLGDFGKGRVERRHVGDVAVIQPRCSQFLGKRADALLHRLALIGKGKLRAMFAQFLRDPPGERSIVGQAHDEPALTLHQSGHAAGTSFVSPPGDASRPSSGSSASAALRCAPITSPSPMKKKKINAIITPARLP